jgi:hypothetical protein
MRSFGALVLTLYEGKINMIEAAQGIDFQSATVN